MIILNELILKLNEKWYDRCRTGKEAIYEYRVFKIFAELAKLQHYGKAAKALNISQPGSAMRSRHWRTSTVFRSSRKKDET